MTKILEELRKACQNKYGENTASVLLNLNAYGWEITINERTPEGLKEEGVNMKNLNGDWII